MKINSTVPVPESGFEENPENDIYLELEFMPSMKENVLYLRAHIDYNKFNHSRFGQALMERLKSPYGT